MIIRELLTRIGFQVDQSGMRSAMQGVANIGSAITGLQSGLQMAAGAARAFATGLQSVMAPAMQMEKLQGDFSVLLGSMEKSIQLTRELNKMAAQTPFETMQLAEATKTLLSFGAAQEQVIPLMSKLGDVALGDAEKFKGLTLAVGQVMAKGRLQGEEAMQMIERGFNPYPIIAKQLNKSVAEVQDMSSKGQISFKHLEAAITAATSAGGRFYQGMLVGSRTLSGVLSTLGDSWTMALMEIGNSMLVPFKALAIGITNILTDRVMPFFQNTLAPIISGTFAQMLPMLDLIGAAVRWAFNGGAAGVFLQVVTWLRQGMEAAKVAMNAFLAIAPQFLGFLFSAAKLVGDVIMLLVDLGIELFRATAPVLRVVYTLVSVVFTLVGVLLQRLKPAAVAILRLVGAMFQYLMNIWQQLASAFGAGGGSIFDFMLSGLDAVVKAIQVMAAVLAAALQVGITVTDAVFSKIKSVISAIGDLWVGLKGVIMNSFLAPVANAIGRVFTAMFDMIRNQINRLVGWANKILPAGAQLSSFGAGNGMFSDIFKSLNDQALAQKGAAPIINNTAKVDVTIPEGTTAKDAKKVGKAVAKEINAAFSIQLHNVLVQTV